MSEIQSVGTWATNGDLIADVAALGWLDGHVLDATYGKGGFWTKVRPDGLVGVDVNPSKSDPLYGPVDFRSLPFGDREFDSVVFDPPYKLSGTPALGDFDEAYGIDIPERWQDRMALIRDGAIECARVARTNVIAKCQDQVVSGQMRWQSDVLLETLAPLGFRKADRFDFPTRGIPQPKGRRQVHARHCFSQLLVFTRGRIDNGVVA